MRSFKIYIIWPQACKQVCTYTHTCGQCSLTSVGLAQACSDSIRPTLVDLIHLILHMGGGTDD